MQKILINGDFFCRRLTGIERYAYEITLRLDAISQSGEIAVIIPQNAENIPEFKNLRVIRHTRKIKSHFFWQMVTLQWFLITHREYMVLEFGNTCLPFAPGIVFLHDIYCALYPGDFITFRDKIRMVYNRCQYRLITGKAAEIITVSHFVKGQIMERYKKNAEAIAVVYNGWEHFSRIRPDYSVFDEHPELSGQNYFFALGSLSKRKNLAWIMRYAEQHPGSLFAVSGASLSVYKIKEIKQIAALRNIRLLGYIGDGKVKALMEKCRAFIMPSYYEGFGIPPLEALSCGAPVIISNRASLPEIYGKSAHYIDPDDPGVDLDRLLSEPVEAPDEVLKKYSYQSSAEKVYAILQKHTEKQ